MNELNKICAGTDVEWSFDHVLADGSNQFVYELRGPGAITINAEAVGGQVAVKELASTTAAWKAGLYEWRLFIVDGDSRKQDGVGQVVVDPNFFELGAGYDPRSHAEKMLDAIKSVLEGRMLSDHESYTDVDGRSLNRIPIMELQKLKRIYLGKVRREKGGNNSRVRRVMMRFPG